MLTALGHTCLQPCQPCQRCQRPDTGQVGECNLLTHEGGHSGKWKNMPLRAVVDLGNRKGTLDGSMTRGPGLNEKARIHDPDVVILTHDDQDHIGGAEQFFSSLGPYQKPGQRELWIPSEWALLVFSLMAVSNPGLSVVVDKSDGPSGTAHISLPDLRDRIRGEQTNGPIAGLSVIGEGQDPTDENAARKFAKLLRTFDLQDVALRIRAVHELEGYIGQLQHRIVNPDPDEDRKFWAGKARQVAARVVKRAVAILEILASAAKAGVRIRHFCVDVSPNRSRPPYLTSGRPGQLTIVNAVPVSFSVPDMESAAGSLLHLSQLTIQNRRALVTFLWPTNEDSSDGVLIWSDSDGVNAEADGLHGRTPWALTRWMTAPHHGSENIAHQPIWDGFKWHNSVAKVPIIAVVSGDMPKKTHNAAADYNAAPQPYRSCTNCPRQSRGTIRQDVTVNRSAAPFGLVPACDPSCV